MGAVYHAVCIFDYQLRTQSACQHTELLTSPVKQQLKQHQYPFRS